MSSNWGFLCWCIAFLQVSSMHQPRLKWFYAKANTDSVSRVSMVYPSLSFARDLCGIVDSMPVELVQFKTVAM
jgi:hypothetical protein